jgi:hypothetical protein
MLFGITILVNDVQKPKVMLPVVVRPEPNVTEFNALHKLNVYDPMVVTLFGITMLVNPLPWNTAVPKVMTVFGIVTLVKAEQP